ncbi:MAG: LptF/LptG family permease [Candidatus Omnitrophota bacterium]
MKILDRYLTKNFIFPLFYCLILFCLLYIIIDIFGHLDEILRNKVPISILYQYYASFIPLIFVQTTPVASLLAVTYMLTALNKNNELVAARACGISIGRLLLPVFAIAITLGILTFLVNERVVSESIITSERIKTDYIEKSPENRKAQTSISNLTVYGEKNQMVYAKEFSLTDNKLRDIIILEHDDQKRMRKKIIASEGIWIGKKWLFIDCIIYSFDESGKPLGKPDLFDKKYISFPVTPEKLLKYEAQTSYMDYKELKNYIDRISGGNTKTINSLKTDLYFKTAIPFICPIIMLLGIPFALTTKRGHAMAGIGTSVVVGLLYYSSIYFSLALGKGGILPPLAAAHFSNIAFFFIALILLRRKS